MSSSNQRQNTALTFSLNLTIALKHFSWAPPLLKKCLVRFPSYVPLFLAGPAAHQHACSFREPTSSLTRTLSLRQLTVSYLLGVRSGQMIWKTCVLSTRRLAFFQDNNSAWSLMVHCFSYSVLMSEGGNVYHLVRAVLSVDKWTEHVPSLGQMADLPSRWPERRSDSKLCKHLMA